MLFRSTRLTADPALDINPFYSPDGRRVAFLSDRSGRAEVWVMAADGSEQRQLSSVGASGHFLLWTRDSRSVIFRTANATQIQIFRVSVDDGALVSMPEVASGWHMSFSPSQARILDVRDHRTLWVYGVDGGSRTKVFEFPDPDVRLDYPLWSPDGRWILFDRAAARGGDLWLVEGIE